MSDEDTPQAVGPAEAIYLIQLGLDGVPIAVFTERETYAAPDADPSIVSSGRNAARQLGTQQT